MVGIMELFSAEKLVELSLFIAKPLIILLCAKVVVKVLSRVLDNLFAKITLDKGIQTFTKSASRIAIWLLAIIMVAGALGVDTASLVTVLGVASLALSLAVQNIFTNVFSGIILLITKPFKVGDFVDICGVSGTVKSVDLMRTTLTTGDNKLEHLPNGDVAASRITNYSESDKRRAEWHFTVDYSAETETVKKAILEVLNNNDKILKDPEPFVAIHSYNANDIDFIVRAWSDNSVYWDGYYGVNEQVREAFKKYNIEFSYPHVVVHKAEDDK